MRYFNVIILVQCPSHLLKLLPGRTSVKIWTTVVLDFCTTCYERPPVLSDRFCWAEGVVAQDRFYCTTKIDGVVCPPNISETVATRIMKLAHRPRIASTMIKLISKPIVLPILLILVKTIQRIIADPKRKLSPPFDSADSVPSLGHPAPGAFGQNAVAIYCALRLLSLDDRNRFPGFG